MAGSRRRLILGGVGAGVAGLAGAAYAAAPQFWKQFAAERRRPILAASHKPDPRQWPDRGLYAAWLGHSTVLLKMDGFTVLTDPVLGTHCGIDLKVTQLGLKRLVAPALTVDELPPVDLVLVSHAHFDHLDTPTLGALESRQREVVMASQTSDLIGANAFKRVTELRWNEQAKVGPLRVKAVEVRHWGARVRTDTYRGYNGYVIESERFRVLFAGDTANTDSFRSLRSSRRFDLAITPIGAYNPWLQAHCTPEQALRMGLEAGAEAFLPVHHQTFRLGREPLLEPIERFQEASEREKVAVVLREIGQSARA